MEEISTKKGRNRACRLCSKKTRALSPYIIKNLNHKWCTLYCGECTFEIKKWESGFAISRILFRRVALNPPPSTVIHLGVLLLTPSCDQPGGFVLAALKTPPYLFLLLVEFSCFHSSGSPLTSRSQKMDQCPGHSLCSTGPHLTVEGRYPLRCHTESGLSSPSKLRATVHKTVCFLTQ